MGIERGEGFVLRTNAFAEADIILTLFLRSYGKRTAIAKGARRINSRLGGVFDLLNKVEVVFYPHDRLDLVSQGTLISSYESLKRDLPAVNSALAVARSLDLLLPLHQREDELYHLFMRFLALVNQGNAEQLRIAAELRALSLLGHRPHLRSCLHCGSENGPFLFVPARGGVLCHTCIKEGAGIPLASGLAHALDWLASHPIGRSQVIHLSPQETVRAHEILDVYTETLVHGG